MWYRQICFEPAVRVPLLIHGGPTGGVAPGKRVGQPVSLLDILPTLLELAGPEPDYVDPIDGRSLAPLLTGDEALVKPRPIISEYTDMGVIAPARMVRDGDYKLIYTHGYPLQLYHLGTDPLELHNQIGRAHV